MPTAKETYQGSLTRGILNPRDSDADMIIHVKGLTGADRTALDTAITTAVLNRDVHPDDASIPLRTATAKWLRGGNSGTTDAEALVFLRYDKRGTSEATDPGDFSNIAEITYRYETIQWWAPTVDSPLGVAISLQPDPCAGNAEVKMPRPKYITVPIMDLLVPVVLSNSPVSTVRDTIGTINEVPLVLTGTTFDANTMLFNGLTQRVTRLFDGTSVTYEYDVRYSFSYRRDGWYRGTIAQDPFDPKQFVPGSELMYEATEFPTFPI